MLHIHAHVNIRTGSDSGYLRLSEKCDLHRDISCLVIVQYVQTEVHRLEENCDKINEFSLSHRKDDLCYSVGCVRCKSVKVDYIVQQLYSLTPVPCLVYSNRIVLVNWLVYLVERATINCYK
jgi:hypothetical protein